MFVTIGEFLDQAWELSAKMKNFMAVKLDFPQGKMVVPGIGGTKKEEGSTVSTLNTCEAFGVINTWLSLSRFFKLLCNPKQ